MNKIIIQNIAHMDVPIFGVKGKAFFQAILLGVAFAMGLPIYQILYAEMESSAPSDGTLDITSLPYMNKDSPVTSERERIDAWEYFFEKIKISDDEMYMRLFEMLHYREYNIVEFAKETKKYGNNPILWLARKNAKSGRLTLAEKTVTTLIDTKSFPEGLSYAYELLGNIKLALNKPRESASAYRLAIKAGNVDVYSNLAFVSLASGDHQTVTKLIPELMKIKNEDTNALETLIAFSRITNDLKFFRESLEGVDESNLVANPRMFLNVLAWLLKTGDPADLLMADRLQKTYPEQLANVIKLLRISGKPNDLTLADVLQKQISQN
jgi:hypothetical protein